DIGAIKLDPRSRDDIPQLLRGLQYIYTTPGLRDQVFEILQEVVPDRDDGKGKVSTRLGRPGMEQWRILVLGVTRRTIRSTHCRRSRTLCGFSPRRSSCASTRWWSGPDTIWLKKKTSANLRMV